jgi:Ni/Fe-hydrogenase subunit HybB-like protein
MTPNDRKVRSNHMSWKSKMVLGVLTALAMLFLTYTLPRGGALRDAAVAQFPVTVGVWAIFVLLFVKLK